MRPRAGHGGRAASPYQPFLRWIEGEAETMRRRTAAWAKVNSHGHNAAGVREMFALLKRACAALGGRLKAVPCSPQRVVGSDGQWGDRQIGDALSLRVRPSAPIQVYLGGHMDTVFAPSHPFREVASVGSNQLRGPGVGDDKGGLAVLITALEAFERSPFCRSVGYEVFINADEELGSPGSAGHITARAKNFHLGLIYEPCLPDGQLVGPRKGSGNFCVVVRGVAAHAGREFQKGRNAVAAACDLATRIHHLNGRRRDLQINVASLEGGAALNIVPDSAVLRFNARGGKLGDFTWLQNRVQGWVEAIGRREGFAAQTHGGMHSPPKPFKAEARGLFAALASCAHELGFELSWAASGGVCDGNRLAAAGLANLDTLGPRAEGIHGPRETLFLDSLVERAQLSALFLMRLGAERRMPWKSA